MKELITALTILFCVGVSADETEGRIKKLELKVERLERRLMERVKVKDMNNKRSKQGIQHRSVSAQNKLSKSQKDEIEKALELYKKRQKESQKLLDELMQEP
ncbi:MAG: hypothetical protein CME64_07930 [Halobacteriovoraceae bacterium]|nr:hypothetical protein [Halobacteriovoraceae bacterium]